ncbi:MAG TPA: adenosylcobinamide-phosphate synthase CbiB [Fibrobacteria bacterium]|nr:adenosylcobinamide-phosphate synthase CbiB [Fibrobacteria bacterium]
MLSILFALLLDFLFKEPPAKLHPVVWMGGFLRFAGRRLPDTPAKGFVAGAGAWLVGAALVGALAFLLQHAASWLGGFGWIATGVLLWPLFSVRMLHSEALSVELALGRSLDEGRARLSRLVSRDTTRLTATEVREAALETLSENLTDSVVAPLLWFAVLGLPGVAVYRFANTADAMWGYRGDWEWKGKWAARADDVLNWIPARVAALLLWVGSFDPRKLPAQARATPSPNGGWTMGALALALGVRLGKPGVYVLNPDGRLPDADDFRRGWRRVLAASLMGAAAACMLAWNRG